MNAIERIFGRDRSLVGVVHVGPLPGSPRWSGDMAAIVARAVSDAARYERAGFHGVIIENYGDAPFEQGFAGRGAVAGLAAVGTAVAGAVELPLGVNVLRNDALSAVAVAAAVGARFIRVNVHTGAAVTDQGIIEGGAAATLRSIARIAPDLAVFADVMVKHAAPLVPTALERAAADAVERGGAAALIVTGEATGAAADLSDVARVRDGAPGAPVLVGSGVTADTIADALAAADGVIVASSVMEGGTAGRSVDVARARNLVERAFGNE